MKSFSICALGGVSITMSSGEQLKCIARDGCSVCDNLLNSTRYVADLISGKISNEEHNVIDFIDIAVQALTTLSVRLKDITLQ